jgi:hypothetical protein
MSMTHLSQITTQCVAVIPCCPLPSSAMRHAFCNDPFMVSLKKNVAWY